MDQLKSHQAQSTKQAPRIAADLGIRLIQLTHADVDQFSLNLTQLA